MKVMLILAADEISRLISANINPAGVETIQYRHVLKAMDNIDEIDPAGIIISAGDFPRHWKTLVQFVRWGRSKEQCPIILLKEDDFSMEEASKAFFIGISGIVSGDLCCSDVMDHLRNVLERYLKIPNKRKARRYRAESWTRFGFCMVHPTRKAIVTTTVTTLSSGGVSCEPDNPALVEDLDEGIEFTECSLRVGDAVISPICRLIRKHSGLSMEFIFLDRVEQIVLDSYLESIPLQAVNIRHVNRVGIQ
ncbi:MAG: PilZ domain-containing protein [Spirochaetaceae bacterium]|jgi:hypothetical protein|nr:PilZ domain-containing protein [Spirochaetaceae bacterium]